jgi:outer membrane translocation and assembly module TamA
MLRLALVLVIALGSACASIEKGRYGVASLKIEGAKQLSAARLRTCFLTRERNTFGVTLGLHSPDCNRPPFSERVPEITLWRWPWTDWPTFNKAVLDKDAERLVRWYRARGFYQARLVDIRFEPPNARWPGKPPASQDAKPGAQPVCNPETAGCPVSITLVVDEGRPVLVDRLELNIKGAPSAELRAKMRQAIPLKKGSRFDEYDYDASKPAIVALLKQESFAGAEVVARADIDTAKRTAHVVYDVDTGVTYKFGKLSVSGQGDLATKPILAATGLTPDTPYTPAKLAEAQREVQALGAFAGVAIEEDLDREHAKVDVRVLVTRAQRQSLRLGFGMQSGTDQRGDAETQSVPQWDLHLLSRYTYRNVFNTLGAFQIEERPRIIFNDTFPSANNPSFGNRLTASINQPGLIEARTNLILTASWDFGPDPYLDFLRSDLSLRLSAERWFFTRRLGLYLAVEQDVYVVPQTDNPTSEGEPPPTSYNITLFAEKFVLDYRNNRVRTSRGWYGALAFSEAPRWAGSDWTLFFVQPEVRLYVPLPFDLVFASRVAVGWTVITDASSRLDQTSQQLGPSVYRLRGGGANSVRGFPAGHLGVGIDGGDRRWEAMFELRAPLGGSLEIAGLLDFGDVSIDKLYLSHLNTSLGLGIRYYSPIGALRLDTSFRLMSLQNIGGPSPSVPSDEKFLGLPAAFHFTIGDAF